jgi:CelD/BcsL family acetyltransferase involved in cellulose biosynthesis
MNIKNQIIHLDPKDKRWMDFIGLFPQANIFHHPDWANLLSECYKFRTFVLALKDDTNSLIAGLPLIDVNSFLTGRRWVSLPFTDYCQPLFSDQNTFECLTQELVVLSQERHNQQIEVRWELPLNTHIQSFSHFVRHTLNLDQGLESISKSLHRTQRQNIKTAEKNGIEIKMGENFEFLQIFYKLHCLTRHRQGVPVQPWRFFELLFNRIIKNNNGHILLAYKDDHCLAAGLFLHWNQTLCYKYAASDDSDQNFRPNHLLTWEAIRWGFENGYKIFDFGRTDIKNEGLRTFKCRWGSNEAPLYYSVLTNKPLHGSNGKLMTTMNRVLRNSPQWVSQAAGELFYKHFG